MHCRLDALFWDTWKRSAVSQTGKISYRIFLWRQALLTDITPDARIDIVGAGASGLTAAHYLASLYASVWLVCFVTILTWLFIAFRVSIEFTHKFHLGDEAAAWFRNSPWLYPPRFKFIFYFFQIWSLSWIESTLTLRIRGSCVRATGNKLRQSFQGNYCWIWAPLKVEG